MIPLSLRLIREHNRIYKSWLRFLWRWYGKDAPIVLMVHGFKPTQAECKSAFEMTATSFEHLMRHLIQNDWKAMSQDELLEMVEQHRWKSKCFYLTFDDIYDTVYTEAFPIIKEFQIPFTAFVTKDLVDKPGYITMRHLTELSRDPLCRIGVHGLQHKVFRDLTKKEVEEQCFGDREWLEQQLGVQADSFAFPYGRIVEVSCQDRKQVRIMGFSVVFSAIEGTIRASWFTSRWFLPRVNVSETFVEKFTAGKRLRYKDCEGR